MAARSTNVPATTAPPAAAALVSAPPADLVGFMEEDAGVGVSTDPNEVGIPFLYILQDLSPQVKKRDPAYIEGAEVGDIYNNVTREVIPASRGIEWIECGFEAAQVEWKPNRGGFAGKHPHNTPLLADVKMVQVDDKMVPQLPSGNTLTETKYHYGYYRAAPTEADPAPHWEPAVIGMASTMIKNSRELEGLKKRLRTPRGAVAPSFSVIYRFSTKLVSKNNNDWYVWDISQGRWVTSEEYGVAREFAQQILSGSVKTANRGGDDMAEEAGRHLDEEVL